MSIYEIGELIKDGEDHLKIVQLQNAVDKTYTYKLIAPEEEGAYEFSGIYQIDGMDIPADVGGASSIKVAEAVPTALNVTSLIIVIVVSVIIVIVIIFLKR